jgi:hypothetical protein
MRAERHLLCSSLIPQSFMWECRVISHCNGSWWES